MKTLAIAAIGLGMLAALQAAAQRMDDPQTNDRRPPRGADSRSERTETLSTAQKAKVKAILSKYKANALTAQDARAIHEAFRQAGIRGGPALNDAVKSAGFDPDVLRDLAPPPGQGGEGDRQPPESRRGGQEQKGPPPGDAQAGGRDEGERPQGGGDRQESRSREPRGQSRYSLDQAISDRAQLSTIAFSGLAFVTGDFGADTFIPPGKVCDYFGFQYMRDIDAAGKGHNPMFLDRVAGNVLRTLTEDQRKIFENLAREQAAQFNALAVKRFPLIKAFYRELKGDIPAGSTGLNKDAVAQYVGDIFAFDAELGYKRAQVFGEIASALTAEQKASLAKMKFGNFNTWPEVDMDAYKMPKGTEPSINVAYMTYASEFLSWYAGSVEADVYLFFAPNGTAPISAVST